MQRIKKVFINLVALMLVVVACFSLTACEDIKKLHLEFKITDFSDSNASTEYSMDIDLYRHLAPDTVDAVIKYVNEGFYDNTIVYKMESYDSQLMMGNIKVSEQNKFAANVKPEIKGEFEYGGTVGSNLLNKKGAIGLWRSWYFDDTFSTSSMAMESGRATWFMPTESIEKYNKYFCVFAQYDVNATNNKETIDALTKIFESSSNYEQFVVYYTGEYDAEKADDDYGLTFNCVKEEDFKESKIENLFKAEKGQLVGYNHYTINVPMKANTLGAVIKTASVR